MSDFNDPEVIAAREQYIGLLTAVVAYGEDRDPALDEAAGPLMSALEDTPPAVLRAAGVQIMYALLVDLAASYDRPVSVILAALALSHADATQQEP